ncbi:SRPBCC family protein [Paenibacillus cellulositrophicus]|uniref:SRPBCC family protein n=1 Tax=Paenibacillus cellulositrophicus TaxID=562959 RepID=UPI00142E9548|nr:SRPBCC domain-containing protein [Paenibacillus cellulositrophicus]
MTIKHEIFIEKELDLVWRAWTEEDRVKAWLAPAARIEPWEGGRYELYPDLNDQTPTGCKLLKYEKPRVLQFEWKGPEIFAETMNLDRDLTMVQVNFKQLEDLTRLSVMHIGWKNTPQGMAARQWHVRTWLQLLDELKAAIESKDHILSRP